MGSVFESELMKGPVKEFNVLSEINLNWRH